MMSSPRIFRLSIVVCSACAVISAQLGCSRSFWRDQADRDSYELISEKLFDETWQVPRMDVAADPRSRFYDPFDIDWEPLPPDDPAAYQFMLEAGGWKGYKSWHKFGQAFSQENPQWTANLSASVGAAEPVPEDVDEDARSENPLYQDEIVLQTSVAGVIRQPAALRDLNLGQLIELAYIHNRDYQFTIETVYLQALAVSQQRFNFGVRYLGLSNMTPFLDVTRIWRPGQGKGRDDSLATNAQVFGLRQALPSGAQWALDLTNSTLWVFSSGNASSSASNLSWSIVQPLLRNAGRKIGMENLTLSERQLLYAVRSLARFRKQFFSDVTGDYLSLLNQVQQISNQRGNLQRLSQQIEISKVLLSRGREGERGYDQQTTQLETQLTNAVNTLRRLEIGLQDAYDRYKINNLGLPPDLAFSIDMSPLKQFELIDPRTLELEEEARIFQEKIWGELKLRQDQNMDLPDEEYRSRAKLLRELFDEVVDFVIGGIEEDFERVDSIKEQRLSRLVTPEEKERFLGDIKRDAELFRKGQRALLGAREIPFLPEEKEDLSPEDLEEREAELGVGERLAIIESLLKNSPLTEQQKTEIYSIGTKVREDLYKTIQNLEVVQVNQRVETVMLTPFDMSMEEVMQIALENRLDLQNARAVMMDARRQVEIKANQLKAVLNLTAQGQIGTPSGKDNPLNFRKDQSSYQVGVEFTTPLNQQTARNEYRQAQINYQRARRLYMQTEDGVKEDVRSEWRQLLLQERNFETTRQSIRFAAIQLDIAVEQVKEQSLQQQGIGGGGGGGQNQNQGLNLLNALNSVLTAQNNFIGFWVNYEQNRINIYKDMGIMQVDERGVWGDDYYQTLIYGPQENQKIPAAPPQMYPIPESELQLEIPPRISGLPDRKDSKVLPALKLEPESLPSRELPPLPQPMPSETTAIPTQPRKGLSGGQSSFQPINPFEQQGYEEFRNDDPTDRQSRTQRKPIVFDDEWESVEKP